MPEEYQPRWPKKFNRIVMFHSHHISDDQWKRILEIVNEGADLDNPHYSAIVELEPRKLKKFTAKHLQKATRD